MVAHTANCSIHKLHTEKQPKWLALCYICDNRKGHLAFIDRCSVLGRQQSQLPAIWGWTPVAKSTPSSSGPHDRASQLQSQCLPWTPGQEGIARANESALADSGLMQAVWRRSQTLLFNGARDLQAAPNFWICRRQSRFHTEPDLPVPSTLLSRWKQQLPFREHARW